MRISVLLLMITVVALGTVAAEPPEGEYVLWYDEPAAGWNEALPVGNGRLGAMVFGGVPEERIQLNDDTLWDGYPRDRINPKASEALPQVRQLLFEGKIPEAEALAGETLMGVPERILSYQSLGDLSITVPHEAVSDYRYWLDLDTGIVVTEYEADGVQYRREVFASAPQDVIVIRMEASEPGRIDAQLTLSRQQDAAVHDYGENGIQLVGQIDRPHHETGEPMGLKFTAKLKADAVGGSVSTEDGVLRIADADQVTLYLSAATNYRHDDPHAVSEATLAEALDSTYWFIRKRHLEDHRRLFRRVDIELGDSPHPNRPTDARLQAVQAGGHDPDLVENYFQLGRYFLIGCSRPGTMPANLQGLWNQEMNAPWNSDYHTNINLQMNYWPAEVTNLSELHRPLFDLMESLVPSGSKTAQEMYGARGWVVHHLTDAWGFTVPADGIWGIWPVGAAWLAQHPYEHYLFTGDREFLRETGYPLMRGAALFMLDFLVEGPEGYLVTNPSHSPENAFITPEGDRVTFTYGCTMDLQIAHDLFTNTIEAAQILETDEELRAQLQAALDRLHPMQIAEDDGRLQEWIHDYEEAEPGHRHMSHLYGLHPGHSITMNDTPELAEAARKALAHRLEHGGGHTGWSRAWIINFWARFHEAEHAHDNLHALLAKSTLPNLFDTHPPFQIDGNFGGTAGIAEMLLQSHQGTVHLLPALPEMWQAGHVTGLRARGGYFVDIHWQDGQLSDYRIEATQPGTLALQIDGEITEHEMQPGDVLTMN